jgi:hypothetical protein
MRREVNQEGRKEGKKCRNQEAFEAKAIAASVL